LKRPFRWLSAATLLAAAAIVAVQPASADILQSNATVTLTDFGFSPANVTIALGGTVLFTNQGSTAHQVTTGSAPYPINLGISPGQNMPVGFGAAGVFHYTAPTDCGPGISKPLFVCQDYTITVVDARAGSNYTGTPLPGSGPLATATPVPTVVATQVQRDAVVTIYDTGVTPSSVTVTVGGSVTWINYGNIVHTASSAGGPGQGFDTGGLGPGDKNSFGMFAPGTYTYTSATDCLHGASTPGFSCGPYQVIVTTAPPAANARATVPTALAPPASVAAAANTNITIDDNIGFQPQTLTIKVGQRVTWTNKGNNVHAVVSDTGAFDSGGIGTGASFTWQSVVPGSYTYHSPTDATFTTGGACNCTTPFYGVFAGTILVGQ